ncbi:MAG: hypothetical protein D3924_04890 [Candidatus Electrothrix sp. AR4]|nr:hypothetical protein [Candidatus Electrothrix sp. AR4]
MLNRDITAIIHIIRIRKGDITRNRMIKNNQGAVDQHAISFFLFLLILFFAPLAFGTTETWSMVTVEVLIAVSGLFYFFPFSSKKRHFYTTPGIVPLFLLLGWLYLQCFSLPVSWVRFLSPNTFAAYQPILELPATVNSATWIPLTVNREATLLESLRLTSYALFYLLTVQLLSRGRRLTMTVNGLTGFVLLLVLTSLLQRITAPHTLFWFRELSAGKTAFGPWVYKNQYAGFMVMTCPVVLAQFLLRRPSVQREESLREKFVALLSMNGAAVYLLLGFGTILVAASVFLTQSRGGILSISFTLFLYFFLLARKQGRMRRLTPLVLFSCLLLIVGWFSWDPVLERFNVLFDFHTGKIKDDRLLIWQDTLRIIADFPLTGSGFGTFVAIFPSYRTFTDNLLYEHAHNDFLELFTDGGLVGCILASWFLGTVLQTGYKLIFSRRDRVSTFLAIGAFSGIAGLLVYSISDFNLHNGANGLYFAFFCGLLVSAGHTRRYYRNRPSLLVPVRLTPVKRMIIFFSACFFLFSVLYIQGGVIIADRYYRLAETVSVAEMGARKKRVKIAVLLEQARNSNPFSGIYPNALGNLSKYQQKKIQALRLYTDAALKQPVESLFLRNIGMMYGALDSAKGRKLLESSYRRANRKAQSLQILIEFELSQGNRSVAVRLLNDALKDDISLLGEVYSLLIQYNFDRDDVIAILPERTSVWIGFWNYAKKNGKGEVDDYFLKHALDFIDREASVQPHYFMQVYTYYQIRKKFDKALEILQLSIQRLPNYAPFRLHLGDAYMKEGGASLIRARQEYEQALRIDPENTGIRDRLKRLEKRE